MSLCNLHCSHGVSDITGVYFLCFLHLFSGRTRASKQRVFMSVSSSTCRGCSEGSFQAVNLKGFSGEWSWPTWRQMASAAYEHLEALRLSADTKNVALTVSIWGLWDVLVLSKSDICLADWMSGLWKRFLLLLTVFLILIKRVQKYWADVINNLCFHP